MSWSAITVLVSIATFLLGAAGALIAVGLRAAVAWGSNQTALNALRTEVAEMRTTAANMLARVGSAEGRIDVLATAREVERRTRRDIRAESRGVPIAADDDDST